MKVLLMPAQEKFISAEMKTGGYLSPDEVIREALRVYQLVEQEDYDPDLEEALAKSSRLFSLALEGLVPEGAS